MDIHVCLAFYCSDSSDVCQNVGIEGNVQQQVESFASQDSLHDIPELLVETDTNCSVQSVKYYCRLQHWSYKYKTELQDRAKMAGLIFSGTT